MKKRYLLSGVLLLALLAGCAAMSQQTMHERRGNVVAVQTAQDEAADNAIVRQHALYDCHFVADSHELNELGKHNLTVLAEHYRDFPGPLNLCRGRADAALYELRRKAVVDFLSACSVNTGRLTILDSAPDVGGMASESVLVRYQNAEPKKAGQEGGGSDSALLLGAMPNVITPSAK